MVIKVITFELSSAQNIRKRKRELSLIFLMTKSCSMFNRNPTKTKQKKACYNKFHSLILFDRDTTEQPVVILLKTRLMNYPIP